MLLDSGADITVVDSKFVNTKQYTKSHITVTGIHGESQSRELEEVWVHVDDLSLQLKVAVVENLNEQVILDRDIGNAFSELLLKSLRNKQEKCEEQAVEVKVTRGQ